MSLMERAALGYAERGWAVFPVNWVHRDTGFCSCGNPHCKDTGKHPLTWNGVKDASLDAEQVREWWQRWPEANIAVACGRASDLIVIDCDRGDTEEEDGEREFLRWCSSFGVPVDAEGGGALLSETGGGGRHYFFTWGPDVKNLVGWLPGVDVRSQGGYVLLPPSSHQSGGVYRWLTDPGSLAAPLPVALHEHLRTAKGSSRNARRGKGLADRPAYSYAEARKNGPPQGARDDFFNTHAFVLRMGDVEWEAAEADMRRLWELCPQPSDDPYPWEEALKKLRRVWAEVTPEPVPDWQYLMAEERRQQALDPVPEEKDTDLGNARRMVRLAGQWLRYNPALGWLVWDNRCWARDDLERVYGAARHVTHEMYAEALAEPDLDSRTAAVKWAMQSENRARLEAMVRLARTMPEVAVPLDSLDQHPYQLVCSNGTVDLATGELGPHRMEDLVTQCSPVEYVAGARDERWEKFLADVTGGDENLVQYLQRAAGYTLTASGREEAFFIIYGPKGSGKSTFLDALSCVLGPMAMEIDARTILHTRGKDTPSSEIASMLGKRLVATSELPESSRLDEALVKKMSGGDKLVGRHLYKDRFQFLPTHKLWVATNHAPGVQDDAIWRRIKRVPFPLTVPAAMRDPALKEAAKDPSSGMAKAVLAWAVEGAVMWWERGLGTCAAVEEETAEYAEEQDTFGRFISEHVLLTPDRSIFTPTRDLYDRYKMWAAGNGEYVMTMTAFGRRMKERGVGMKVRRGGDAGFEGVGLKAVGPMIGLPG